MASALSLLVSELVVSGAVSAASAILGDADRPLAEAQAGWQRQSGRRPVGRYHRFDIASLTKPWTATLALALDRKGILPLAARVREVWPQAPPPLAGRSLDALLRHRAGMLAWRPLYRHLRSPARVVERLLRCDSTGAAVPTYSDLGYMLWGRAAEAITGVDLMSLLRRHVLRPLGVTTVETAPDPERSLASRLNNDREVELAAALGVAVRSLEGPAPGIAQDGNARFLGGLPGHAGLFAPARALWRLGAEWLEPSRVLTGASVAAALAGRGRYRLGWWRRAVAPAATGP